MWFQICGAAEEKARLTKSDLSWKQARRTGKRNEVNDWIAGKIG